MIKITYNRNNPLVHRFISHIDQSEVNSLLTRLNTNRQFKRNKDEPNHRQPRRKTELLEQPFASHQPRQTGEVTPQRERRQGAQRGQPYEETRFGQFVSNNKKHKPNELRLSPRKYSQQFSEPSLGEFVVDESNSMPLLKQGYLRLWYEKMALQNNFNNLVAQNAKKDEVIHQLRQELQQKNGHQANIFFTPQAPLHAVGPAKGAPQNASNHSIHSTSLNPQHTPSAHWGQLHPSRNFNIVTARSNF